MLSDKVSCRGGLLLTLGRGRRGVNGWSLGCLLVRNLTIRIGSCHDRFAALLAAAIIEGNQRPHFALLITALHVHRIKEEQACSLLLVRRFRCDDTFHPRTTTHSTHVELA